MSPSQETWSPSEGNFEPLGDKAFYTKFSDKPPLFFSTIGFILVNAYLLSTHGIGLTVIKRCTEIWFGALGLKLKIKIKLKIAT